VDDGGAALKEEYVYRGTEEGGRETPSGQKNAKMKGGGGLKELKEDQKPEV